MIDRNDKPRLASPSEQPAASIVIYDGQCKFCCRQVERLAGWDRRAALSFLSLHDSEVARRFPDLTHEELMKQMYLIDPRGNRYVGAVALMRLSRELPVLWPLAPILNFPGTTGLWQWLYQRVAKHRYRWGRVGCESASCDIHFK